VNPVFREYHSIRSGIFIRKESGFPDPLEEVWWGSRRKPEMLRRVWYRLVMAGTRLPKISSSLGRVMERYDPRLEPDAKVSYHTRRRRTHRVMSPQAASRDLVMAIHVSRR
jgi:hypothetical protein